MNKEFLKLLQQSFYGNTFLEWIGALLSIVVVVWLIRKLQNFLVNTLGKNTFVLNHTFTLAMMDILKGARLLVLLAVAIWITSHFLTLSKFSEKLINTTATFAVFFQIGLWVTDLITRWIDHVVKVRAGMDTVSASAYGALGFVARLIIWTLIGVLMLENLGVDVTTLIAGLGVGSIALALAVQNILGDVLCSISIILDKPFEVGDFINIGDMHLGVVENIGVKSTRLKSLHGEQIVIANSDLLKSRILNYKRMSERRVVFKVGITYQTPVAKVELIVEEIRNIVSAQNKVRLDRAHFAQLGDSSLVFEVVYFVLSNVYAEYMDIQQNINLEIMRFFEREKIQFAYPTQTVFIEKAGNSFT